MSAKEHKVLTEEILSAEQASNEFLIETGISTNTGQLTKKYSKVIKPIWI
jgi:hypothetical protein